MAVLFAHHLVPKQNSGDLAKDDTIAAKAKREIEVFMLGMATDVR